MILTPDGRETLEIAAEGRATDAARIGRQAGADIRDRAGPGFFAGWS
jgi:hydroxymethylbilane synthase